jgi:glycosyltransferase involved in cell wall biosynthesis
LRVSATRFDIVIPTLRRPTLSQLLLALDLGRGPAPERVVIVDDRARGATRPLPEFRSKLHHRVTILRSQGHGPAAARNLGWRACRAPWIVFLDDDVLLPPDWLVRLHGDLARLGEKVVGSQGRSESVASSRGLAADVAYRRGALESLHGFDERFLHAHRADADLAIRARRAGYSLARGRRRALHPIGPRRPLASVRAQTRNADDVLLAALHGAEPRRIGASSESGDALLDRTWREAALQTANRVLVPPAALYHRLRGHARVSRLARRGELAWPPAPQRTSAAVALEGRA